MNDYIIINFINYTAWLEIIMLIEYPYYNNWSKNDIFKLKTEFMRQSRKNDFYAGKIDFQEIYFSVIHKMGKDAPRLSDIHS